MTERHFETDPHLTYDDLNNEAPERDGSVALWAGIGLVSAALVGTLAGGMWMMGSSAPTAPEPRVVLRTHPDARLPSDAGIPASGTVADAQNWMFGPGIDIGKRRFASAGQPDESVSSTPLPPVNPVTVRPVPEVFASAPLPQRNPLGRDRGQGGAPASGGNQVASLPPAPSFGTDHIPVNPSEVALPTVGSGYAVYDIKGKTVYMPNGERLEAHSGYGEMVDDPRHVSKRMVGPTPPNVYNLTPREALFHGVEALRLNPAGDGKMYGRTGLLAHTYLLGPRGDSNGCVSFKNYDKFLAAYKRGEIKQLVVVAELSNAPARNPLLAWFAGNNN